MRPEYDFAEAVRGVTAKRHADGLRVVLDADVAAAFPDARAVNEGLRTLLRLTVGLRQRRARSA